MLLSSFNLIHFPWTELWIVSHPWSPSFSDVSPGMNWISSDTFTVIPLHWHCCSAPHGCQRRTVLSHGRLLSNLRSWAQNWIHYLYPRSGSASMKLPLGLGFCIIFLCCLLWYHFHSGKISLCCRTTLQLPYFLLPGWNQTLTIRNPMVMVMGPPISSW